jgi:hypothetical protein
MVLFGCDVFFPVLSQVTTKDFPNPWGQKGSAGGSQSRGDPPTEKLRKMMTSSGNYTVDICSYQFSIYQSINLSISIYVLVGGDWNMAGL